MKASDYIVSFLEQQGVRVVFGYIGGMVTHLVDSLGRSGSVRYIQTYHEQTAAIAAEGYALESGRIGVAVCTSGPGVTNMMTGIADAYFDSVPVLFITGQVNTGEFKYDKPVRQQGFQEMDVTGIVGPITKYTALVDDPANLRYELEKAVYIATHGRKGPVVLDLPMDVSRAEIDPGQMRAYTPAAEPAGQIPAEDVLTLLEKAERPVILVGGGCADVETGALDRFIRDSNIPVVTSLKGRGMLDETLPQYVGMIGSYGVRCANMAVERADLLIALGSRLDTRQTGARYAQFLPEGRIIHVDIDPNELAYNRLGNRLKVHASVSGFLEFLSKAAVRYKDYTPWNAWIDRLKAACSQEREIERFVPNKSPYRLMQHLSAISKEGDAFTVDVGQNQMWAAQTLHLKRDQRFVSSGGLAPMGFSMPAAIGIAFANPSRRVICITGDGGFQMSVQALLTIAQYKLNIHVIVVNNASLGMITQFQHLYFGDRMVGTTREGGYLNPDLRSIADACGIGFESLEAGELNELELRDGPALTEFLTGGLTTVSPKLEFDKPFGKPSPQLPDAEYDAIMQVLDTDR